jgi:hypothetical protein
MFHPWRALRALPNITVKWVHLSDKRALTNGVDVIWMDKSALQVERRCSLTHELIHIEKKHTSCQPLAIERKVRAEAARRLIPIGDLAAALAWAHSFDELADDLWVKWLSVVRGESDCVSGTSDWPVKVTGTDGKTRVDFCIDRVLLHSTNNGLDNHYFPSQHPFPA